MTNTTAQMSFEDLMTARSPKEVDADLAAAYTRLAKAEQHLEWTEKSILGAAGAKYYYRGRNRVTDMTIDEALPVIVAALADGKYLMGSYNIRGYGADEPTMIERYEADKAEVAASYEAIRTLNAEYTGWSRFFLVTSSSGHIHSSMCCSTCRITTTYGWLPTLSGETEAEAVAEHGSTLCSVCFPSAPVDWVGGKITKAQAEKKAAK